MRMTNKIMQTNSLYNINQTKVQEDKYNTQLTSQSKITRPSDDPVVAIRALRLRSNVTTADQYYSKNAPDADKWLTVTAESMNTITSVLTDLYKQVETGVNKDYTASDMRVLLTQIQQNTHEVFATGNQDYAGRYIFTGYRTDTALTFDKSQIDASRQVPEYKITEYIDPVQLDVFNYTDYSVFDTTASASTATELQITNADIHRIRLSYKSLSDDEMASLSYTTVNNSVSPAVSTVHDVTPIIQVSSAEEAYKIMTEVANNTYTGSSFGAIYVPSSGELLFGKELYDTMTEAVADGGTISTTYTKKDWLVDDLNPEHYFYCEKKADVDKTYVTPIKYNEEYKKNGSVDTEISYDVGYNQTIQVNTNASEVFNPSIKRDQDDLENLVKHFEKIETLRESYKEELAGYVEGTADYIRCKKQFDAADKAYTYIRDAVSKRFGDQISRYQQYMDETNVAITKNGTRRTRLDLITERLESQKATFKELQESNEGIDMTEVAIHLTAAETTYDAALMATSKIMQNSLINYI